MADSSMPYRGDAWLRPLRRADAGPILFGFPPAGAGPTMFRRWLPHLPPGIELVAVHTPGRESRINEPPLVQAQQAAAVLAAAVGGYAHRPFILFGHSMGALLAREVAAQLAGSAGGGSLRLLVVAGTPPPHLPVRSLARAGEAEILAALTDWGGTPDAVLRDVEVLREFLPCLRADFALAESCRRPVTPHEVIDVPLLALAGTDDRHATAEQCAQWGTWTRGRFAHRTVPGGHFFPFTAADTVLSLVLDPSLVL